MWYYKFRMVLGIPRYLIKQKLHRENCIRKHFSVLIHGIQRHVMYLLGKANKYLLFSCTLVVVHEITAG